MTQNNSYRFTNKTFICSSCGRRQKKLVSPQETKIYCSQCQAEAFENVQTDFNRENHDRTYRMVFNQNGETHHDINQYHNRTDIFDRNRQNIYGDPRDRVVHLSQEEINQRNLQNIPTNRQNINNNIYNREVSLNNPFDFFLSIPVSSLISPFNGSVNRHPHNHIYLNFFTDFFNQPSSDFFNDNYASNFSSNFINPMTRIIFIRTVYYNNENINRPATPEALSKLKRFKMNEEHTKKKDNGEIEYPSCTICLMEVAKDEDTILVPCGHMYHEECIIKWFKLNNKCPVCRFELTENQTNREDIRNNQINVNGNVNNS